MTGAKLYALSALAAISLLGPVIEIAATGRVEPFGKFDFVETFLAIAAIYAWYYVDKAQRNFRAGPLQNIGVILVAVVALPIYFIRSRGWRNGSIATLGAAGALLAIVLLDMLGETIGAAIGS